RRHHLHWRILQECREAYLLQGRVSEGSGPSLQLESRRKRTPRDRHPRRRRSRRVRLQGARSPSGRPQQFWQVETFEESQVLRDSAPEQVRHRGGGGVVPPERTQVEDGLDSRKERIVGLLDPARRVRRAARLVERTIFVGGMAGFVFYGGPAGERSHAEDKSEFN